LLHSRILLNSIQINNVHREHLHMETETEAHSNEQIHIRIKTHLKLHIRKKTQQFITACLGITIQLRYLFSALLLMACN
jgi:hypothetical protein